MRGEASAPASSANLGPGFDTVALALGLRCIARVEQARAWLVVSDGSDPGQQANEFIAAAAAAAGVEGPLQVEIESEVPRASGLGSSAAVAIAVAAAAIRATGREPARDEVFRAVAAVEGHGDNAAAGVYGGLAVVAGNSVLHFDLAGSLVPVVAVPGRELLTSDARTVLPTHVPLAAAARNVARGIALIGGLRTGDPEMLAAAAGDELHETYRAGLSPGAGELMAAALAEGALHAAWSGAGPSVLAIAATEAADAVAGALERELAGGGTVLMPGVDRDGLG